MVYNRTQKLFGTIVASSGNPSLECRYLRGQCRKANIVPNHIGGPEIITLRNKVKNSLARGLQYGRSDRYRTPTSEQSPTPSGG